MTMGSKIHPSFWLGVLLFYAGLIVYIIGFASPNWLEVSYTNPTTGYMEINQGLWYMCLKTTISTTCEYVSHETNDEYMRAVEGLQVIALFGFTLTIIFKFAVLCSARFRRSYRRSVEFTLLASVIFGLLGVAVYGGACRLLPIVKLSGVQYGYNKPMAWAFALDLTGLVAMLIAVFLVAAFNKDPRAGASHSHPTQHSPRLPPEEDERYVRQWDLAAAKPYQSQPRYAAPPPAAALGHSRKGDSDYLNPTYARGPYLVPYTPSYGYTYY